MGRLGQFISMAGRRRYPTADAAATPDGGTPPLPNGGRRHTRATAGRRRYTRATAGHRRYYGSMVIFLWAAGDQTLAFEQLRTWRNHVPGAVFGKEAFASVWVTFSAGTVSGFWSKTTA